MFPFSGLTGLPNHEHLIGCLSRGSARIKEVKISYCRHDVIKGAQKDFIFYESLNETNKQTSVKCNLGIKVLEEGTSLNFISYLI